MVCLDADSIQGYWDYKWKQATIELKRACNGDIDTNMLNTSMAETHIYNNFQKQIVIPATRQNQTSNFHQLTLLQQPGHVGSPGYLVGEVLQVALWRCP